MKYVGSKRRLAKKLAPIIESYLKEDSEYIEPFVGGANMIQEINWNHKTGADSNQYVIALLNKIKEDPKGLPSCKDELNEELYQKIKATPQSYPAWLVGYAGIPCSYSGKWFGGYPRDKQGNDYIGYAFRNAERQAPKIQRIDFFHSIYLELKIPKGSVVYCDPPYISSLSYRDKFNSKEFWRWAEKVSENSTVLVSEYTAPDHWTCIFEQEQKVTVALDKPYKTKVEKLFKLAALN